MSIRPGEASAFRTPSASLLETSSVLPSGFSVIRPRGYSRKAIRIVNVKWPFTLSSLLASGLESWHSVDCWSTGALEYWTSGVLE